LENRRISLFLPIPLAQDLFEGDGGWIKVD